MSRVPPARAVPLRRERPRGVPPAGRERDRRDAARAETWQYPGEGARRVVDYLTEKLASREDAGEAAS